MTGTTAGVNTLELLRSHSGVFLADFCQLCLHIRLLLCFFQIILPPGFQFVIRVSLHPQATEGILHHIADDPVRCKQLGCRWNVLLGNFHILLEGGKYLVFFLCIVILI